MTNAFICLVARSLAATLQASPPSLGAPTESGEQLGSLCNLLFLQEFWSLLWPVVGRPVSAVFQAWGAITTFPKNSWSGWC